MLAPTQDHIPIEDIKDDVVILKDGSVAVIIQSSAVNFGLLSEQEQLAVISAFASMLNSLSFMIQIVILSKKLDISSYLEQLDSARQRQPNPLLSAMIGRYRDFIKSTILENEVLDKRFYIVIPVSYLETGSITKNLNDLKKYMTVLGPRRDQIIRQMARIGLKATQLSSEELIRLFYDIYNEQGQVLPAHGAEQVKQKAEAIQTSQQTVLNTPPPPPPKIQVPIIPSTTDAEIIKTEDRVVRAAQGEQIPSERQQAIVPNSETVPAQNQGTPARRQSFVVEELPEDYGTT